MERLTERTAVGILVKENCEKKVLKTLYSCYGEKPNSHYTNCEEGYCAMEKLAAYEDLEEQGLLLRLPYPFGTEYIYFVDIKDRKVYKLDAEKIEVNMTPIRKKILYTVDGYEFLFEDFEKAIFLTREEAEVRLKEFDKQKGATMNIDEFIEHTKEKAKEHRCHADFFESDNPMRTACTRSAEDCEWLADCLTKFKEYQQLEEQGRLIKLPCKVGDKIFLDFAGFGKDVDKFTVKDFHLDCFKDGETILFCDYESNDRTLSGQIDVMEFGKTVFLTKSEAEAKLKELRGGENESSN